MQKTLFDHDPNNNDELIPAFQTTKHIHHIIQDTSKEAYHQLLRHPKELNSRHKEYLQALHNIGHPATDQEISRYVGHKDPNYFRPRRYELQGLDEKHHPQFTEIPLIRNYGKRKCKITSITAHVYWFTKEGLKTVGRTT